MTRWALLLLTLLGGCVTLKPYQREQLARPGMILDGVDDNGADRHVLESREGSSGGNGAAGGGCGCN